MILDGKNYNVEDRIAFMRNLGFEDKTDINEWHDNRSSSNIMNDFVLPKELLLAIENDNGW